MKDKGTGRLGYIPEFVRKEIDNIKKEDRFDLPMKDTEAFRKLIGYARIGKKTIKGNKITGQDNDIF